MTVAAELAKTSQQMEYFVTFEGVGWPTDWGDLSSGFDGDVFVTNDIDGTLASDLGCTIHHGLNLPSGISESFDPKTTTSSISGLGLSIVDNDDWWLENFTPRKAGTEDSLDTEHLYHYLDISTTSGSYATGDIVWLGGRECVKLGTKAGNDYTGSTRGYLGTPIGSSERKPDEGSWGVWPAGTVTDTVLKFWYNRKVALWAHVPGESVGNCLLLWMGRLRGINNIEAGIDYQFDCVGDFMLDAQRVWRATPWVVYTDELLGSGSETWTVEDGGDALVPGLDKDNERIIKFVRDKTQTQSGDANESYGLALAYHYRTEAGGVAGAVTAWDAGGVQALDTDDETDVLGGFININGDLLRMKRKSDRDSNTDPLKVLCETFSSVGTSFADKNSVHSGQSMMHPVNSSATFMLDNWHDDKELNRFTIDNQIRRNPIDILLMFLTSCDREIWLGDEDGTGTTTVLDFTPSPAWTADEWIGKALFCVEQADNKGEAREITDNATDTITVSRAFSAAPTATEYQIRNSIYDVLPAGWGLGIDTKYIDVSSFEDIKEKYGTWWRVGKFIMGTDSEVDIWSFLHENICQPYGILLYFDATTRKIKARYIGQAIGDGVVDDYTAITTADIIRSGDLNSSFTQPVGTIELTVRSMEERVMDLRMGAVEVGGTDPNRYTGTTTVDAAVAVMGTTPAQIGGSTTTLSIRSTEVANAFAETHIDTVQISALFDTTETCGGLAGRLEGLTALYSIPPPVWSGTFDIALYPSMTIGSWVTITWADAPTDPYSGARGWANMIGRVLERNLPLDGQLGFGASIELFGEALTVGKVAPAATITSLRAGGANPYDYLGVNDTDYVADPEGSWYDWYGFAVGDVVEIRNKDGALDTASKTITSFGSNQASTPQTAASSTINFALNDLLGYGLTAGDYVTFVPWSGSATSNMEDYSPYADASGALTGGDNPRIYSG